VIVVLKAHPARRISHGYPHRSGDKTVARWRQHCVRPRTDQPSLPRGCEKVTAMSCWSHAQLTISVDGLAPQLGPPDHPSARPGARRESGLGGFTGRIRIRCRGYHGRRHGVSTAPATSCVISWMRTHGSEVARGRWGRSLVGGVRSEAFPGARVAVFACCAACGLVAVRHCWS
jgi:hypothetical protein